MLAYGRIQIRAMANEEEFRTTIGFSTELLAKIDEALHEAKRRGEVPRSTRRNPYILMLLEQRCDELIADHAKPSSSKKR